MSAADTPRAKQQRPRQNNNSGMRRVLVHAAFQREYQNRCDAVLMQAGKCATFASRSATRYLKRIEDAEKAAVNKFQSEQEEAVEAVNEFLSVMSMSTESNLLTSLPEELLTRVIQLGKANYFPLLPEAIVFRIMQLARQARGQYVLERQKTHDQDNFKYAQLHNGVMLNVSNQPEVGWILGNINILHLPEKYWKDWREFGQTLVDDATRKHVWENATRRLGQDSKRFDSNYFREDFIRTFQQFANSTDTIFSLWCVPFKDGNRRRYATTHHKIYVYETRMQKQKVLHLLHTLLGEKCTEELAMVKSVQIPNRDMSTTVVFLMGMQISREHIEHDVLFVGFSSCLQDPRIEPISQVPEKGRIYL